MPTESGEELALWAIPLTYSVWRKWLDGLEATRNDPDVSDDFIHELVTEWGHQIFDGSKARQLVAGRVQEWQRTARSSDEKAERDRARRNLRKLGKDLSGSDSKIGRRRIMDIVGEQQLIITYEYRVWLLRGFSDKRIKRQWDILSLGHKRNLAQTVGIDHRSLDMAINGKPGRACGGTVGIP
jgi:hypothetical protein